MDVYFKDAFHLFDLVVNINQGTEELYKKLFH